MTASTCITTGGLDDTKISVVQGSCSSPVCVTSNDDDDDVDACDYFSRVHWATTPGDVYYIIVADYSEDGGAFGLQVDFGNSTCGDGVAILPEECDLGDNNGGAHCTANCELRANVSCANGQCATCEPYDKCVASEPFCSSIDGAHNVCKQAAPGHYVDRGAATVCKVQDGCVTSAPVCHHNLTDFLVCLEVQATRFNLSDDGLTIGDSCTGVLPTVADGEAPTCSPPFVHRETCPLECTTPHVVPSGPYECYAGEMIVPNCSIAKVDRIEPSQLPVMDMVDSTGYVTLVGSHFSPDCDYSISLSDGPNMCDAASFETTYINFSAVEVLLECGRITESDMEATFQVRCGWWVENIPTDGTFTFKFSGEPVIYDVSPVRIGPNATARITIRGENFGLSANDLSIDVGGLPCTDAQWEDATTASCQPPSLTPGNTAVTVTSALAGTSIVPGYLLVSGVPEVISVEPTEIGKQGGARITISGKNFGWEVSATTVTVGGVPCLDPVMISDLEIQCTAPPFNASGTTTVSVSTAYGGFSSPVQALAYRDGPLLTSAAPSSGPTSGGDTVVFSGSNLGPVGSEVEVFINGTACLVSRWLSDTSAACTVPPGPRGKIRVTIRSSSTGEASFDDLYSYHAPPSAPFALGAAEVEADPPRGITTVRVSFLPPDDDGGADVVSYSVRRTPGDTYSYGAASPVLVTGVLRGANYSFDVTAVNAAGASPPSASVSLWLPALPCPAGSERSGAVCVVCPEGMWSPGNGEACVECPLEAGCIGCDPATSLCLACELGAGVPSGTGCYLRYTKPPPSCVDEGKWWHKDKCVECPRGGVCAGGGLVHPTPGNWAVDPFTAPVQCEVAEACPGSDPADLLAYLVADTQVCADGYAKGSPRCARCAAFYERDPLSAKCTPCTYVGVTSRTWSIGLLGGFMMLGLCFALAFIDIFGVYYIVNGILAIQKFSLSGRTVAAFSGKSPVGYNVITAFVGLFTFDLSYTGQACGGAVSASRDFDDVFFNCLVAVLLSFPLVVIAEVVGMLNRKEYVFPDWKKALLYRTCNSSLIVLTLAYLQVCVRSLQALHCQRLEDDGQLLLVADATLPCLEGPHALVLGVAIVLVVVYVAGFPIAIAVGLFRRSRTVVSSEPSILESSISFMEIKKEGKSAASLADSLEPIQLPAVQEKAAVISPYHVFAYGMRQNRLWFRVVDILLILFLAAETVASPAASSKVFLHFCTVLVSALATAYVWPYEYGSQNVFQVLVNLISAVQGMAYFLASGSDASTETVVVCLSFAISLIMSLLLCRTRLKQDAAAALRKEAEDTAIAHCTVESQASKVDRRLSGSRDHDEKRTCEASDVESSAGGLAASGGE